MEGSASTPASAASTATSSSTVATPASLEQLNEEQVSVPWGGGFRSRMAVAFEARGAECLLPALVDGSGSLGGYLCRCALGLPAPLYTLVGVCLAQPSGWLS